MRCGIAIAAKLDLLFPTIFSEASFNTQGFQGRWSFFS
jgi:hypothetical protein